MSRWSFYRVRRYQLIQRMKDECAKNVKKNINDIKSPPAHPLNKKKIRRSLQHALHQNISYWTQRGALVYLFPVINPEPNAPRHLFDRGFFINVSPSTENEKNDNNNNKKTEESQPNRQGIFGEDPACCSSVPKDLAMG